MNRSGALHLEHAGCRHRRAHVALGHVHITEAMAVPGAAALWINVAASEQIEKKNLFKCESGSHSRG